MLEDFFQYTKLASGDVEIHTEPFELNELLRQFYEDEEESFLEKGMTLQLKLCDTAIKCEGDIALIARVVGNLLSNALKYAKRGTQVELTRFFERLYKKDHARNDEGSGLGLSIAKNIIQLHGGKIQVRLEEERIIFIVWLPDRYTCCFLRKRS